MGKDTKAEAEKVEAVEVVEAAEFELSLDEACARISATDRRVEMLGGFHAEERAAGRFKDLESAYRDRFAAFCNAPA
jgi:hypothetical protein